MKDRESITGYYARTMEISNKMCFHGENMENVTIFEKILCSMTPKFDYVKMNRSSISEEQALKASTSTHLSNSRGMGRGRGMGNQGNRDGSRHFKADDGQFQGKGRRRDQHFDKSKLIRNLKMMFGMWIRAVVTTCVEVMENGDIEIRTKNGFVETISNVLYVPNLKNNLLSAGQLQEKGYVITIQKGVCEIYDSTRGAIAVVQMSSNRLFPLKITSVQSCLVAEVKDYSWLWHFCYDHLSFGGLKTLQQKNMVAGLFLRLVFLPKFVKNVLLANNIVPNFPKRSHGEHKML
ncbi:hypothetical protein CK203_113020 [Vitis vinifera]|uniref:Retrovirus-related Pol polyprotein from transposon TNT 1-94 n=1 Tax=Vitis vinifera TaxID=29760 RepID=A0A438DHK7_VITVI|nr:hypothetical protein CK203_113020 [Vitis vinifera]